MDIYPDQNSVNAGKSSPMDETFLQRELRRRMRARGLSGRKLSELVGDNDSLVKSILSGKSRNPRIDTLEKIAAVLKCRVDDLLGDVTAITNKQLDTPVRMIPNNLNQNEFDDNPPYRMFQIDELDVSATGGSGALHGSEGLHYNHENVVAKWELPSNIIRGQTNAPAQNLKIITVIGDSMVPLFLPGERVMVDISDRLPSPAGIFALWDGFGQIIKRLEMVPYSVPAIVRLVSANADYIARELPFDQVIINGRIIGKWQWT